jgi:hypothetical protein
MARYFFHIDDGKHLPDRDGLELPNLKAARAEAVKAAGSMIRDEDESSLERSSAWQMAVTDEADQLMFTLRFSLDVPTGPITYLPDVTAWPQQRAASNLILTPNG